MKATSLPSSAVDRSTGENNITVFYANSDSGLLFIICGHCSPVDRIVGNFTAFYEGTVLL